MKKTKIVLEFEKDKLDALVFYLQKKEEKLEKELETVIEELYQKRVPAVTREYLESRMNSEEKGVKTKKDKEVGGFNNEVNKDRDGNDHTL